MATIAGTLALWAFGVAWCVCTPSGRQAFPYMRDTILWLLREIILY